MESESALATLRLTRFLRRTGSRFAEKRYGELRDRLEASFRASQPSPAHRPRSAANGSSRPGGPKLAVSLTECAAQQRGIDMLGETRSPFEPHSCKTVPHLRRRSAGRKAARQ